MLVPICYIWVNQTVLEYRLYTACFLFTVLSMAWRVTFVQVWFDMDYKLMRLDYRPSSGAPPYYSNDPITEIHDYTIGGLCNPSKPFPSKNNKQSFSKEISRLPYFYQWTISMSVFHLPILIS